MDNLSPNSNYVCEELPAPIMTDNSLKTDNVLEELPSKVEVTTWFDGKGSAEFGELGGTFGSGIVGKENNADLANLHISSPHDCCNSPNNKVKLQSWFDGIESSELALLGDTFGTTSVFNDNNARGTKRSIALANWKWDEVINLESSEEIDLDDDIEDSATSISPPRKIPKVTIHKRNRVLRLRDESDDEDPFRCL